MTATITVVGGQKGGSGKSTIAHNMAVALARGGARVAMIDTDMSQNTTDKWHAARSAGEVEPRIHCEIQTGAEIEQLIDGFAAQFDHVVIDTGGADSQELRIALTKADLFVSPLKPAPADLWTLKTVHMLLIKAHRLNPRLSGRVVLTMAPTNRLRGETAAAENVIKQFPELALCRTIIRDRAIYLRALGEGRGVLEYAPSKLTREAIAEVTELHQEIYQ